MPRPEPVKAHRRRDDWIVRTAAPCAFDAGDGRGECGERQARMFLVGPRCIIHSPGTSDISCPHHVAWTEHCVKCAQTWGSPAQVT